MEAIEAAGIEAVVFDRVRVEPTAESLQEAADFAVDGDFDGFVGRRRRLEPRHREGRRPRRHPPGADHGLRQPAGRRGHASRPARSSRCWRSRRRPAPGRRRPRSPILDIPDQRTKSGISHRYLRPHQGIVDPELTRGLRRRGHLLVRARRRLPRGRVVRLQALRPRASAPESPDDRPPYQGANPVSDVWSAKALEYGGRYLRRAVADADDLEARGADDARRQPGRHRVRLRRRAHPARLRLSDRVAEARVRSRPAIPDDHPFVPHGWSVIVTAPAAFRFTYEADPEKHRRAAELIAGERAPDARREHAARRCSPSLMRDVGAPSGVRELGYGEDDVDDLVEGAIKQQRLLVLVAARGRPRTTSPRSSASSMENWAPSRLGRSGRITSDAHAEHRVVAVEARERALDALEAPLAAVVGEARDVRRRARRSAGRRCGTARSPFHGAPSCARDLRARRVLRGDQRPRPTRSRRPPRGRRPRRAARRCRSRA